VATGAHAQMQGNRLGMSPVAVARPQAATLYLALFLALLAFFLFLTSISSFDPARAVTVIDSVEAQFAEAVDAQAGPERSVPHFAGPAGQRVVADAGFTDSVTEAFAALTGQQDMATHVDGAAWHAVRLDPEAIFVRETAALSAQGRQAIEAAAAAMAADSGVADTTRRIDIAVGGPQGLALRRAVALASAVTSVNGPQSVSLRTMQQAAATPGFVELVFYTVAVSEEERS